MNTAGYSGTPLAKKLGIKANAHVRLVEAPEHYFGLFSDWPAGVIVTEDNRSHCDLVHLFTKEFGLLKKMLPGMIRQISPNGCIWVSWPKKASKIATDVTEDRIRELALQSGLVDIKVCAVDETWSGLKLVIPVKDRKK